MGMPDSGFRTEKHFIAFAPGQHTPFDIFPVKWRVCLCSLDEVRKELTPEEGTAATRISMGANAFVIVRHKVQYLEKASSIANFGQAGLFAPATRILEIDLRGNRENRRAPPLCSLAQR